MTQPNPDPLEVPPEQIESVLPPLSVGCARAAIMAALAVFWITVALRAIALAAPSSEPEPTRAAPALSGAPLGPESRLRATFGASLPAAAISGHLRPVPSQPVAGSSSPTSTPATRSGTWAYANLSHGSRYLAIPEGRGIRVTICGPLGCLSRVSTDAGPALYLQRAGRIGDLSSVDFVTICGPTSRGLCRGGWYTIELPIRLPATDAR